MKQLNSAIQTGFPDRVAKGNKMVNALIYLVSDALSYVTEQNIIVDGG